MLNLTVDQVLDWAATTGFVIVLILIFAWVLQKFGMRVIGRIVKRSVHRDTFATPGEEEQRVKTVVGIIGTSLNVVVAVLAGFMILSALGINVAPLVAGAGIAGIALGFGAQSLVKDFLSGGFIIMENQYRVGDIVEINGKSGKVSKITMRETVIRDLDGNLHHMPNGTIELATNKTIEFSRINMDIRVSYDSDIDKVEEIINNVGTELATDDEWKHKIVEAPQFERVDNLLESAIEIKILGKTQPMKQWSVAGEFRRRLLKAFAKHHIVIPYQQIDVHNAKRSK